MHYILKKEPQLSLLAHNLFQLNTERLKTSGFFFFQYNLKEGKRKNYSDYIEKILPALSVSKGCHKDEPVSPKATTVIVSTHKGDPVSP